MDWMRERRGAGGGRDRGQAMVESAIVIPVYVFLILGLLQLGLIHQARMMTKYAAYKAVRAGSLHNANVSEMRKTALWTLLPLVSRQQNGVERITPVATPMDYEVKWLQYGALGTDWIAPGMRNVDVDICGPTQDKIQWKTDEIDFDDPEVASAGTGGATQWKNSQRTKLRVQVTFNYRLPIPFANWMFHNIALGKEITRSIYMGQDSMKSKIKGAERRAKYTSLLAYDLLSNAGIYVWPIRASYSMRMQSNLYKSNLPSSDASSDRNGDCPVQWL